ncbi:hypothetical protein BH09PAT1_BH09PAT1_5200 [soil metagenome]
MENMKKILFLFICIVAGVVIGSKFLSTKDIPPKALPQTEKTVVENSPAAQNQAIIPTTLKIPSLGVVATVESVGMDSQGRMDIPKNDFNVAWYNLGFKPGSIGSSVIDGHFDRASGAPAIFYTLNKLKNGDKIIVADNAGHQLTFVVTDKSLYPFNDFPLQKVFNTTDQPRLNLITCDGVWNSTSHKYSQRLVIFAVLESS